MQISESYRPGSSQLFIDNEQVHNFGSVIVHLSTGEIGVHFIEGDEPVVQKDAQLKMNGFSSSDLQKGIMTGLAFEYPENVLFGKFDKKVVDGELCSLLFSTVGAPS